MFKENKDENNHPLIFDFSFNERESCLEEKTLVCGGFEVKEFVYESETNKKSVVFQHYDIKTNRYIEILTSLKMIKPRNIDNFLEENGIVVKSCFTLDLSEYLQELIQNTNITGKVVTRAGFSDDLKNFYLDKDISKDKVGTTLRQNEKFCEYLKETGDINEYNHMLKEYITYPEIQLPFVLGFVAPVSTYVKSEIDVGTMIIAMDGRSTTGKSTSLALLESVFACPKFNQSEGFARTANSTQLSLTSMLENVNGVPVIIDDISATYKGDVTRLIMNLECGTSKGHMNKDYSAPKTYSWSGLIACNSEMPLLSESSLNGAKVRLFSFSNIQWTKNARQAEEIKRICNNNYAFYGRLFVTEMLKIEKMGILKEINDQINIIRSLLRDYIDSHSDRIINKLGIIAFTTLKVKELLKDIINIDYDGIINMLVNEEIKHFKVRNLAKKAFADLQKFVKLNSDLFSTSTSEAIPGMIGLIQNISFDRKRVYLKKEAMDDFFGHSDYSIKQKAIISVWKQQSILIVEASNQGENRLTIRKTLAGKIEPTYCFEIGILN